MGEDVGEDVRYGEREVYTERDRRREIEQTGTGTPNNAMVIIMFRDHRSTVRASLGPLRGRTPIHAVTVSRCHGVTVSRGSASSNPAKTTVLPFTT